MTAQEEYRLFAGVAPDLPLFLQPWYLDAVCEEGIWDVVTVKKAGRIVAVLPYFLKRKLWWRYIAMPRMCKFLGPYLLPEYRNLNNETRMYRAMIERLPAGLAAFEQDTHYGVTNWLPFYWNGFRQTTRYSYVLSLDQQEEALFDGLSKSYRQKIRMAAEKLEVRHGGSPAELHRLMSLSFSRQGLEAPLSPDFLQRLCTALETHHAGRLLFAVDPETGAVHSSALLAWDNRSAYYLASGDDPALRASGSALLLKWEAILFAKNVLKLSVFDFEGSMIQAIEIGRRDFGARQQPYFRLQREWSRVWMLGKLLFR